jgi:predicted ATPase
VETIELRGLDESECSELIASLLGKTANQETVISLRDLTRGNPLYLTQVARHLARYGDTRLDQIPSDMAAALAPEMNKLPATTREVLAACAVAGEHATRALLALVLGDGADALLASRPQLMRV